MKQVICDRLARMASSTAQERFITQASVDAYYVPEELIDEVADIEQLARRSTAFSVDELEAIRSFQLVLDKSLLATKCPAFLSTEWCCIRAAAHQCLKALGGDLAAWEAKEFS